MKTFITQDLAIASFISSITSGLSLDRLARSEKGHVEYHFRDPHGAGEFFLTEYKNGRTVSARKYDTTRSRLLTMSYALKNAAPGLYVKVNGGGREYSLAWPETPEQTAVRLTAASPAIEKRMRGAIRNGASPDELKQVAIDYERKKEAGELARQPLPSMASAYLDEGEL
jgi:hypothetical protein